jgi:hypothetical protein
MAKKTRIDRRGKIRSIVKRWNFTNNLPHWSVTKRASVNRRRRVIDDLWLTETISVSDSLLVTYAVDLTEELTTSDAVSLNDAIVMISSATVVDTGGVSKHAQPSSTSTMTMSDSLGFNMQSLNSQFNNFSFNFALFNGVGYDQEFYTDSVTMSDSVSLNAQNATGDTASVSDSIGFSFQIGSVFNANVINLSQFNG